VERKKRKNHNVAADVPSLTNNQRRAVNKLGSATGPREIATDLPTRPMANDRMLPAATENPTRVRTEWQVMETNRLLNAIRQNEKKKRNGWVDSPIAHLGNGGHGLHRLKPWMKKIVKLALPPAVENLFCL